MQVQVQVQMKELPTKLTEVSFAHPGHVWGSWLNTSPNLGSAPFPHRMSVRSGRFALTHDQKVGQKSSAADLWKR